MIKKTNFWGFLLLPISLLLLVTTGWIGVLYSLLFSIFKLRFSLIFKRWAAYFMKLAVSIDQLGNVMMQDLFNKLFITNYSLHKFGNEDETISSVLGKNKEGDTLSPLGQVITNFLDKIDKNHSLNSIEN